MEPAGIYADGTSDTPWKFVQRGYDSPQKFVYRGMMPQTAIYFEGSDTPLACS
jgi:hypothetical protein